METKKMELEKKATTDTLLLSAPSSPSKNHNLHLPSYLIQEKYTSYHDQIKTIQNTMECLLKLDIFGKDTNSNNEKKRNEKEFNAFIISSSSSSNNNNTNTINNNNNVTNTTNNNNNNNNNNAQSNMNLSRLITKSKSISKHHKEKSISTSTTHTTESRKESPSRRMHQHHHRSMTPCSSTSSVDLDGQLQRFLYEKELLQAEYSKIPVSGGNALSRRKREELEARLDEVDSRMRRIRLKIKRRYKKS
ncbi:hypothetical protein BJ944DRAFT_263538, partial [Cunninghamella echinulata]